MKNIHLIPTDKPSRLYLHSDGELQLRTNIIRTSEDYFGSNQHIYITNSEEIKEEDWIKWGDAIYKANKKYTPPFKKIILSTDPQLIQDGIQAIDDDFLEWFVKNPSCEEVEIDKGYRGVDLFNYKIIIPKKEPITCPKCRTNNFKNCYSIRCPMRKEEPKQTDENGKPLTYWGGLEEPKQETQGYICPETKKQCDDECCVSAEDCHIKASIGILSEPKQETLTYTEASKKEERIFNAKMTKEFWKTKQETTSIKEAADNNSSLLERAMMALDDYLNAGCKKTRRDAAENAKFIYKEYYGIDYINRNNR